MRTSELRTATLETMGAAAAALGLALVVSPRDLALHAPGPHVVWLPILVVAARYGTEAVLLAVPIVWGALAAVGASLGAAAALGARLERAQDLGGLVAAVLIGWVAASHERRQGELAARLEVLTARDQVQQASLDALEKALVSVRARADRLHLSLSFLRDVTRRLDGRDPEMAAQAALDLILARLGARAGLVQLGRAAPLATAGTWSTAGAPDLGADRAIAAAIERRAPVRAIDLPDARPADADLAAPLLGGRGAPIGVLAVRGVPHGGAGPAALQDLAVVAAWFASTLDGRATGAAIPASSADDSYASYEVLTAAPPLTEQRRPS